MKTLSILLITLLFCFNALGQDANFDLAEKFNTENLVKLAGSTSVRPSWLEDIDKFWYSYKTSDGNNFYLVDALRKTKQPLFDPEYMASELTKITNKPYNSKDLPIQNLEFNKDNKSFGFEVDSIKYKYILASKSLVKKDSVKKEERDRWKNYSPDSTWIVFARHHNLYLLKADDPDSNEIQLTTDGERWYSYNQSDGDTTSTKRLRANASWFEDSKKIYLKRQDKREIEDLFVINSLTKPRPSLETYKYAMPGEDKVFRDELFVIDIESHSKVEIDIAKWKDQSIGGVYFGMGGGIFKGEGSDKLYFIRRDRTWSKIDVCRANTETGEVKVLFSEESKPYFNTRYANLAVINDGEELIWWSERNGWGQLYLYDGEGNLKNKITSGNFVVGYISQIDTLNRIIFFQGFGREKGIDPYYNMYYRINFNGTGMKLLTPEDATHSFNMSESNQYFVDNYSRIDQAPKSVLRDASGNIIVELETTDMSRLLETGWEMPETFKVKAADGVTDLYGVMWKPFNFNPETKYPIITYVYPGPQSEPVPKPFTITGSRGRNVALAQVGFVVVAVGQRGGSPQRSKYYHNYGYDNLRDYPLADNKTALEQMANRFPFIDINRVGIYGHSGGGFMSTAAMLSYPDFYKVAVSSAGNHDNNIYNIWWGEVHHGVKEVIKKKKKNKDETNNGEGNDSIVFKSQIPTNISIAKNLKGHLLLVHGDTDNNVHPANTIRLVDALIKADKRFDFMIMPGKRHSFANYSKYFERMLWYYFAEHLLFDYRNNVEMFDYQNK